MSPILGGGPPDLSDYYNMQAKIIALHAAVEWLQSFAQTALDYPSSDFRAALSAIAFVVPPSLITPPTLERAQRMAAEADREAQP